MGGEKNNSNHDSHMIHNSVSDISNNINANAKDSDENLDSANDDNIIIEDSFNDSCSKSSVSKVSQTVHDSLCL